MRNFCSSVNLTALEISELFIGAFSGMIQNSLKGLFLIMMDMTLLHISSLTLSQRLVIAARDEVVFMRR